MILIVLQCLHPKRTRHVALFSEDPLVFGQFLPLAAYLKKMRKE
jgi:hypothetical protein